jgi:hypothetical protein
MKYWLFAIFVMLTIIAMILGDIAEILEGKL